MMVNNVKVTNQRFNHLSTFKKRLAQLQVFEIGVRHLVYHRLPAIDAEQSVVPLPLHGP